MPGIFAAMRSGVTSQGRSCTPTLASRLTRLNRGMRMESVGACCKSVFLTNTPAHTRTQYSYFGEDGLLRRHLYTVDVLGGAQGANYATEYRAVDGVMLATRRRVFAYDDARQKAPAPVLVSIDLSEIHFE
jgi:hypothetical protein